MPTPKKGESKDEFISRCMGYDDMQKYDQDQRAAICYSYWNEENQEQTVDDDEGEDAWGNVGTPHKCFQCGGYGEEYTDETCLHCGGYGWINEQSSNAQIEVKKVSKPSKASNRSGQYFITKGDKIYIGSSKGKPNWIKKDSMVHSSDWEGGVLMSKQQADKKARELEQINESTRITEKAKSKDQQQLMGMVYAYKKGELKDPPKKVKEIAKQISKQDAKEYAETKHKGLPTHVKEALTRQKARTMSFEDFVNYTTPRNLNEEWQPVDYQYVWIDGDGNKTFIRVTQKEEGGKVNVQAHGEDNGMGYSLANLMHMRPELSTTEARKQVKGAVQELFFGNKLNRPTKEQVLKTLRRVTRLDNIRGV